MNQRFNFSYFGKDFSAGLVVFLVALPLCLGIAHASDAPPMAGIISGVIGGIVVGAISGSNLGVSGPAAGLASIIGTAIKDLGAFEIFLVAVVVAGIIQIILGVIGAGKIAYYFPSSVIKGMLAAIGIIIILKEIPHLFGIDKDPVGESSFDQPDGENTFTELLNLDHMILGAVIIGLSCFAVLLIWETKYIKKRKILANIPAPLLAVLVGFFMNKFFPPHLALGSEHMVQLPVFSASDGASSILTFPKFSAITNWEVLKIGIVIAVVASLETLLCVEATDRLDPKKNITPTNRELIAQGTGNVVSGLIGGLPVTQVIVRSSANINAGGQTKISAIVHGILLMACVLFIPNILNSIPEAALAAILIVVGYKLAKPTLFKKMFVEGQDQFIPFIVTVAAIYFTDLLVGVSIGLLVGIIYVIYTNFKSTIKAEKSGNHTIVDFKKDVFFYNRAELMKIFSGLKAGDELTLDGQNVDFIDHDIFLAIEDFVNDSVGKNIKVNVIDINRKKITFMSGVEHHKQL